MRWKRLGDGGVASEGAWPTTFGLLEQWAWHERGGNGRGYRGKWAWSYLSPAPASPGLSFTYLTSVIDRGGGGR